MNSEKKCCNSRPNASEELPKATSYYPFGILLALLPFASFVGQYLFSLRAGTQQLLFLHFPITAIDWVFVPFNYFVVRVIDWRRGERLYLVTCISVTMTLLTHAFWQYNGVDAGHLITKTGIVLPAGWIHIMFSIFEMMLLVAFVFCRKVGAPGAGIVRSLALTYFLVLGIGGYLLHGSLILSDAIMIVGGFFFLVVYPWLIGRKAVSFYHR